MALMAVSERTGRGDGAFAALAVSSIWSFLRAVVTVLVSGNMIGTGVVMTRAEDWDSIIVNDVWTGITPVHFMITLHIASCRLTAVVLFLWSSA